jgi:LPXTG-motif cell wall-anchored protein
VTKIVEADGRVTITHRFDYEWRLTGTHCKLSTRGRWTFADRLPAKRPRTRAPRCEKPGPVERLFRLDPPNLSVRRDASRQLRVRALDANGCRVATPVRWRASAGRIDARGTLFTEGVPRGDRIEAIATAGKAKALFVVTVGAVDDPLPALGALSPGRAAAAPARYGAEVTLSAGASTGGNSNLTLVAIVTLLAGIIGTLALRRRRRDD